MNFSTWLCASYMSSVGPTQQQYKDKITLGVYAHIQSPHLELVIN